MGKEITARKGQYSLVQRAHEALEKVVAEGDIVIDATLGNGHDTLFLARCVGDSGHVYGFDIQQQALKSTLECLDDAGTSERVTLYHAGHELIATLLPDALRGAVRAMMFNLGYLPGGDKSRTTTPGTTLAALTAGLEMLSPGGVISVIAYTGHRGGRDEADAVKCWAGTLPRDLFNVRIEVSGGEKGDGPEWIFVARSAVK